MEDTVGPGTKTIGASLAFWMPAFWFGALTIFAYAPVLLGLMREWQSNEDVSHGFLVPLVAGYIVWTKRAEIAALRPKPNPIGLAAIAASLGLLTLANIGAERFLTACSLVFTVGSLLLYLGGWPLLRILAFPVFLLFFSIPLPSIIYNQITFPLQLLASSVAETVLSMLGIPVFREGNIIELASQKLSVVEACSGIRSLLSLTFISLLYGFFFEEKLGARVMLFFSAIPIAIVTNSARVTITGILSEYNPELARGLFHIMEGWVVFILALGLLFLAHKVLSTFGDFFGRGKARTV